MTGPTAHPNDDPLPDKSRLLQDLLRSTELYELFESYRSLAKVPVAIIDLHGHVLLSSRWQRICTDFHRVHPTSCARCLESDTLLAAQMTGGTTCAVYSCRNGLVDAASPIVIDGTHVANVFLGQFLTEPPDEARFLAQADTLGFDRDEYLAALREVPIIDKASIPTILGLLERMTRVVVNLSHDRKRANDELAAREQAEAELERKNRELSLATERLAVATRAAGIGIWDWNLVTNELFWDDAACRMYGLTREEFGGTYEDWARRVHPDDLAAANGDIQATLRGEVQYAPQFRIVRPDGSIRHIKADSQIVPDSSGRPVRFVGTNMDVTERVQAEEALRYSEEKFRMAFTTGLDAFYLASIDDGRIIDVNPVFKDIFGYHRDEVIGRTSLELGLYRHPEDRARMVTELKAKGSVRDLELEGLKRSGEQIWVSLSVSATMLQGKPLMLGVIKDITARKRAEAEHERLQAELQQAQKMESVGRLAGGVAHDFNNLLTAITGYATFVLDGLKPDDPARADVQEILSAGERAAALTAQLLAFSRKQLLKPKILDLNAAVTGVVQMLARIVGEDVILEARLSPQPCWVLADPGQLDQVLLNLSVNARDAMPSGGTLSFETRCHDDVVHLMVGDTGCGMARDVLSHIFEPFYTTKTMGKSTGLGLSSVYGIVQQSGGEISVDSTPGLGTSFHITFPQVDAEPESGGDRYRSPSHQGTETILLVDDEELLLRMSSRVLSNGGYTVLTAASGEEALSVLATHGRPFDLLVTDVVMPGMNGRELAQAVTIRHPTTATLFVSGYTDDAIGHHGVLGRGVAFLHKPFTPEALLASVREVLDR